MNGEDDMVDHCLDVTGLNLIHYLGRIGYAKTKRLEHSERESTEDPSKKGYFDRFSNKKSFGIRIYIEAKGLRRKRKRILKKCSISSAKESGVPIVLPHNNCITNSIP
uniref:Uncharacterized protein n=2 Tax=viral metagenome TaxID=1070528 RepID=A0A6M3IW73_9ZZZZ